MTLIGHFNFLMFSKNLSMTLIPCGGPKNQAIDLSEVSNASNMSVEYF
jgi:hypothetical protein